MSNEKPKTGTAANPTPFSTNLREPICFYCERALVAKSGLHWCAKCGVWFRVRFAKPCEALLLPPVTVMI